MLAPSIPPAYRPREAGKDVLFGVLHRQLETFVARAAEADRPVPAFVEREIRAYLACGIPAHGFTWLQCQSCDEYRAVPFSCKGRGFCPSCGGRRMNQVAANLVDRVLPVVPVRQWVIAFPMPLRFWLARRPALRKTVLGIFVRVVFSWYRKQARAAGHSAPQFGAVCFHQLFGSALNLNLHFHLLGLDGYYTEPDGELTFHAVSAPSSEEVQRLVETVRARVERALRRRGLYEEGATEPEEDALFSIQAASAANRVAMGERAGRRVRRLQYGRRRERKLPRLCGESAFFNLHAAVRIRADDRAGLERLCRYVARPPLSHQRLRRRDDGLLSLALKTPWSDGTTHLLLSELELVEKLAAIVPPPKANLGEVRGWPGSGSACSGCRRRRHACCLLGGHRATRCGAETRERATTARSDGGVRAPVGASAAATVEGGFSGDARKPVRGVRSALWGDAGEGAGRFGAECQKGPSSLFRSGVPALASGTAASQVLLRIRAVNRRQRRRGREGSRPRGGGRRRFPPRCSTQLSVHLLGFSGV